MSLTLHIENFLSLDDGGPISVEVPETGLSVGRAAGMGWVLPDVSRHISGHHFDVVFDGASWWLRDLSTNGTFLQGQRYRLGGPHRLSHGDRLQVGQYVIVVLMGMTGGAEPMSPASLPEFGPAGGVVSNEDPWMLGAPPQEPVNPLPPQTGWRAPDFGQEYMPMPSGGMAEQPRAWDGQSGAPQPGMPGPLMPDALPPAGTPPLQYPPHLPPAQLSQIAPGSGASVGVAAPGSAPPRSHDRPDNGSAPRQTGGTPDPAQINAEFVHAFCHGAGLPPEMFHDVAADILARDLGAAVRHVAREVMFSLQDRAAAKQFALAGDRTMRAATDNNPLKFLPDPEQAIEAMFLRPRAGFQTGPEGLDDALKDLRLHQAAVFAALQPALAKLLADLSPEHVKAAAEAAGARSGVARRARAWDIYQQNWDAKSAGHDNGMLDEFLEHFSTAYRDVIRRAQEGAMPADLMQNAGAGGPPRPDPAARDEAEQTGKPAHDLPDRPRPHGLPDAAPEARGQADGTEGERKHHHHQPPQDRLAANTPKVVVTPGDEGKDNPPG